jgi:hypothetical protein
MMTFVTCIGYTQSGIGGIYLILCPCRMVLKHEAGLQAFGGTRSGTSGHLRPLISAGCGLDPNKLNNLPQETVQKCLFTH